MNGPEHYAQAQRLLGDGYDPSQNELIAGLVHAVLALTAATVDGSEEIASMSSVWHRWDEVGAAGWTG